MKHFKWILGKALKSLPILFISITLIITTSQAAEVIKIGVLMPFTGVLAYEGNEGFQGFEVARVEQNAKGGLFGKQIEFAKGDAIDAKVAVSEAERLITVEGVKVIIGTFSSVLAFAATTVAEKNRVIYLEYSGVAESITARGYKYTFRNCPPASNIARIAANYAVVAASDNLGIPVKSIKVAVVGEDSSYGKSVSENIKTFINEVGANLVAYELYDMHTKDLSSLIMRVKAQKPDALIATCYVNDAILLHRQMRQLDFNVKVFAGPGGHNQGKLKDAVGDDVNGVIVSGAPSLNINTEYAWGLPNFLTWFDKVWKKRVDSVQPFNGYNTAWTLFRVIESAGSADSEAIRKAAVAMDKPEGFQPMGWGLKFAGPDAPNAGQNLRSTWFVEQWQKGSLHTIWPPKAMEKGIKVIMPFPKWSER